MTWTIGNIGHSMIVIVSVVGVCSISCAALAESESTALVTGQFIADYSPGMKDLRWPLGGHYLLAIRNSGEATLEIKDITLNGVSVPKSLRREGNFASIWFGDDVSNPSEPVQKLVSAGEPIWYKLAPATVPAGELGFVIVKTRVVPQKAVELGITDSAGHVHRTTITAQKDKIRLAYVGFGERRDRLVVFVRKLTGDPLTINKVYFDEDDITPQCDIVCGNFWADVGIVTASFAKPFEDGSYHLLRVTTSEGAEAVDIVRARKEVYRTGI